MIKTVYNTKDTTIYERFSKLNTGLDSILNIQKVEVNGDQYNSRILLSFNTAELSSSVAGVSNPKFYLKLTATEPSEIPVDYTIYAYPISGSWNMGTGRYANLPTGSDGATWVYRSSTTATASAWLTSSYAATVTGSWTTNHGGGNWYTSSAASQSFSYETSDINMDITSIALAWISGTIANDGLILKKSNSDESSSSVFGNLQFFSKDTHTVYQPCIEVKYDDSFYHTSYSLVNHNEEVVVGIANLQQQYSSNSVTRFNISARPKYPAKTFATSSGYLINYQLPSSSYYSIVDAHTNEDVIAFDSNYTKISADSSGNFFKADMSKLFANRYYKILLKTQTQNSETYIYDKNWIFRILK
jgi:hypothetical protein